MNYRICFLSFFLLFSLNISSQNDTVATLLPKHIKSRVYKKLKVRRNDKSIITKLSSVEGEDYSGVYTFRLSYQPHYPTRMFLLFKQKPYILLNLGFDNPIGVIKETCQYLSLKKCDEKIINCVLKGIYTYVYEEYGLCYGRHFQNNSKKEFNDNVEKDIYIRTHIRNWNLLENKAQIIVENKSKLPESIIAFIDKEKLNEEEVIVYLRLIVDGLQVSKMDGFKNRQINLT